MPVSPEVKERINREAALLTPEEYLRPGTSFDDFTDDYSHITSQAKSDQEILEETGMDFKEMEYYEGLGETLHVEHATRINAEADLNSEKSEFVSSMPKAVADKALLMAAARFVVSQSKGPEARRVFRLINKGNAYTDTLKDNLALVKFIRRFSDIATQIRPGGKLIDDARLNQIEADALRMLSLHGDTTVSTSAAADAVDRQARLLTLCIRARNRIKLYAEMAFYDNVEYYNRYYAIQVRRPVAKSDDTSIEETLQAAQ